MTRTILFFIGFWLSVFLVLPIGIISFLLWLVGLRKAGAFILWIVGRAWAKLTIAGSGSRLVVEGAEKIPKTGGLCIVGNHPGDFDVLIALALIPRPFGFIAKKEVLYLPMIGIWVWLLGGVLIDRKNNRKAFKAIADGAGRIKRGGAMVVFPEGTRSRGDHVLPFRAGAFKLATLSDAPIVPMSIKGSWRVWEEARRIRGAILTVRFGDSIPTAGLRADERRGLSDTVRESIIELGNCSQ